MIDTAIIPVAGKGTRMAPATRALPKALFPLIMPDGQVRVVADLIARQALQAGCGRIVFVTSAGQEPLLRQYFDADADLAGRVEYVPDVPPWGFGYAVWAARQKCRGNVMVMLGDHIHLAGKSGTQNSMVSPFSPMVSPFSVAAQVAEAFAGRDCAAMIGVQVVPEGELRFVGACGGEPLGEGLFRCRAIIEKPTPAQAAERLRTPGLPPGRYLAHAGIYVFTPEIFDCLDELVAARTTGEVGLTDAQQLLLARHGQDYLLRLIQGSVHDTGNPQGYLDTQAALLR